ncbi:hypothetical protein [Xanthobacter versatilis]|uniref:hypothetical protein n=1 Tax=Xanthobacter autotrophicus (strain ATCC BAA-1158 / Py2) TaxID=78245 RepID=UPI0037283C04
MIGLFTIIRGFLPAWSDMARSSQISAARASHKARYDLFRALGHDHAAALRCASGDEP